MKMIINKELLKAGNYLEVVPTGIHCTLKYNDKGILEKVYTTTDTITDDSPHLDLATVAELEKADILMQRIALTQGITYVQGVLHPSKTIPMSAELYEGLNEFMLGDIKEHPKNYMFYAVVVTHPSIKYMGAMPMRSRLTTLGFKTLPGYAINQDMKETEFEQVVKTSNYPFKFPVIQGYYVMTSKDIEFVSAGTFQTVVKKVTPFTNEDGYINAILHNNDVDVLLSYTDVCNFNIQPGTYIVLDKNNTVIYSEPTDIKSKENVSRETKCPICGKLTKVPAKGFTTCSDEHCVSRIYNNIKQITNILNLPALSFDEFTKMITKKNKDITCIADILNLDRYKDIKITTKLSTLLHAVIPVSVVPNEEYFIQFVNSAGSLESVIYYLHNPGTIAGDLRLNPIMTERLTKWLYDNFNVLMLDTFLNYENITIEVSTKKFDGAPIFRNKNICITGKFRNGSLTEIMSILESYSARVFASVNGTNINKIDCVLVGNLRGEDPEIVTLAQEYSKPIYEELEFFKSYEIDKDLAKLKN